MIYCAIANTKAICENYYLLYTSTQLRKRICFETLLKLLDGKICDGPSRHKT